MLEASSEEVAKCYEKARESRERANSVIDMATRLHYLDMETRWLMLARCYDLRGRLAVCADEAAHHLDGLAERQHAVPRVMCPHCGRSMAICRVEPSVMPEPHAEVMTFVCECEYTLKQTIERLY
jgi:hypothetical protein